MIFLQKDSHFSLVLLSLMACASSAAAFQSIAPRSTTTATRIYGYLDDLTGELNAPDSNPDPENETREATRLAKEDVDRFGVGDWKDFVDFNEFDGGDGQMGVAGDGSKGLDKEWDGAAEMAKSKTMSAKNAWGRSTGYANELIDKGVETSRAQQLENWKNQREVVSERNQHKWFTEDFDKVSSDENWRELSKFGVERTQDFDLNDEFGEVTPGGIDLGVIELTGRMNVWQTFEFSVKNPFMGFSDFRAAFTSDTNPGDWSVEPTEGSLNGRGDPTKFLVKFRPSSVGVSEGFLVVETDEDKWTYKLLGSGSM